MFLNIILFVGLLSYQNFSVPDGDTIINRSIEFHDPENNWPALQARLNFSETRPNGNTRYTSYDIDNRNRSFCITREMDGNPVQRHFVADSCYYTINERNAFSEKEIKQFKLNAEYSNLLKNYYLYLWGLPMKLKDPGTHIDQTVKQVAFNGKESFEVTVSYDKDVGSDLWHFYFDPTTYELVGYKFFHDNGNGKGEYVILSDLQSVTGLQIPKSRSWYTAQDSSFLGTDILTSVAKLSQKSLR
ncbi:MAG: hypothetical protein KDC79_16825 [Cyclobacteriaceae bacterium]|nr:hypothetical protein [Cyclobacteriaceae bacterium]